jgi:hypothetical protein
MVIPGFELPPWNLTISGMNVPCLLEKSEDPRISLGISFGMPPTPMYHCILSFSLTGFPLGQIEYYSLKDENH